MTDSSVPPSPAPPGEPRKARVRMTGAQRRRQLLEIGRELFAERGYEGASIEELALRADVSKPVVYEHFGGKEGIYAVIVDREVEHLSNLLIAAIERGGHPRQIVERAALELLNYIETTPAGFRVLSGDNPVLRGAGMYSGLLGDVAAAVEKKLARHFHSRGFDPTWAPVYSHMLVGSISQVGQWWLDERTLTKEEVAMHVVNLAWNGLVALEREPRPPRTEEDWVQGPSHGVAPGPVQGPTGTAGDAGAHVEFEA